MKEVTVCASCGRELKNPMKIEENQNMFCFSCSSQNKNSRKKIKWEKCYYSDENLGKWV